MTIQELMEKRAKAWDTARDFLDSKRNANGLLSEEDSKTYDAMEQQIVDLGKEIERQQRADQISQQLSAATTVPIVGAPGTHVIEPQKQGIDALQGGACVLEFLEGEIEGLAIVGADEHPADFTARIAFVQNVA